MMSDYSLMAEEYLNESFAMLEAPLRMKLAEISTVHTLNAGDRLLQTGEYFRSVLLVIKGRIELYREGEEGGEYFLCQLLPGNACAMSMVGAGRQEISEVKGIATEESVIIKVPAARMDELVKEYTSWYHLVIDTYRRRFEELMKTLDDVVFKGMDERLLSYLRQQNQSLRSTRMPLTHAQIANDLNSSREVISRLLKKLEQHGLVKLARNYIEWRGA